MIKEDSRYERLANTGDGADPQLAKATRKNSTLKARITDSRLSRFLAAPFRVVRTHRQLLFRTTVSELRGMYAGSVLGIMWVAVGPLLLLAVYATIYAVVFRFRPMGMTHTDYVLYICAGLMAFISFAGALSAGAGSLSSSKEVLLNTVFPAELIPFRVVLMNSTSLLVGIAVVVLVHSVLGATSPYTLLVPILVILQVLFVAGVVWLLALANLIMRDVQQSLNVVILALMIVTPIAYTPTMVPAILAPLIYVNPLAYYVVSYQYIIVMNELPPLVMLIGATVAGLGSFCGGYAVFRRAKHSFFDYV